MPKTCSNEGERRFPRKSLLNIMTANMTAIAIVKISVVTMKVMVGRHHQRLDHRPKQAQQLHIQNTFPLLIAEPE